MAWPYIVLWDILIDPAVYDERVIFLVSYSLYAVAYGWLASSGSNLGALLAQPKPLHWDWKNFDFSEHPAGKAFFSAIGASLAAGLAAFLSPAVQ